MSNSNDFHGLVLPLGVDQKLLYSSSHCTIATYAMSIDDLDRELTHVLGLRGAYVKEDSRQDKCGKCVLPALASSSDGGTTFRASCTCCSSLPVLHGL